MRKTAEASGGATDPEDPRIAAFAKIVEDHELHGLVFQHLALCRRRAWLHLQRIDYAHLEKRMALGSVAHEIFRPRDISVVGLMGIAPDRIDWVNAVVVEAKNGAGAADAVGFQTLFYAIVLTAATGRAWRAENDILSARRRRAVRIDDIAIDRMLAFASEAAALLELDWPPKAERKPICNTCSYRFLCGHA